MVVSSSIGFHTDHMSAQSGCVLLGYLSLGIPQWLFGSGRVSDVVSETLQQADLLDLGAGLHSKVGEVNFLEMSFNRVNWTVHPAQVHLEDFHLLLS